MKTKNESLEDILDIMINYFREASGTLMMTAVRRSAPRPTHAAREREAVRMTLDVRTTTSSSAAPPIVTQRYGELFVDCDDGLNTTLWFRALSLLRSDSGT